MPFRDPQRRREWEREYRRAYRLKRKAEEAERRAREAELRSKSLVPMRLRYPLEFSDRSYAAGEIVWVLPGTVWLLERARLAEPVQVEWVSYGVRTITL